MLLYECPICIHLWFSRSFWTIIYPNVSLPYFSACKLKEIVCGIVSDIPQCYYGKLQKNIFLSIFHAPKPVIGLVLQHADLSLKLMKNVIHKPKNIFSYSGIYSDYIHIFSSNCYSFFLHEYKYQFGPVLPPRVSCTINVLNYETCWSATSWGNVIN